MERRTLLKSTAVLASGMLAGCFSESNDSNGGKTQTNQGVEAETVQDTQTKTESTNKKSGKLSGEVISSELQSKQTSYDTSYYGAVTVENTGDVPIFQPRVMVKFLDSEGNLLEGNEISILHLKSGQKWDVYSQFLGTESTPETVEAELKPVERLGADFNQNKDLKRSEVQLQTGETTSVTGKIKNKTGSSTGIMTYAQFVTENNTVLGGTSDIINGVSAGETWSFNCEFYQTNEKVLDRISDYELYVFGQ